MSQHMTTKKKLKSIDRKSTFNSLLEDSMLDDKEKEMMKMHYIEGKSFDFIADSLGYSKAGILKIHKKALNKLVTLL